MRRSRNCSPSCSHSMAWKALEKHMALVGVEKKPGRSTHGFRKAFVSMARAGGANPDVIRALTHTGKSRDVLDLYTQWPRESFCEAVQCASVDLPQPEQAIRHGS